MEGSVFLDLMDDLRLEGWTEQYERMYQLQQQRVSVWQQLPFPFGSEMVAFHSPPLCITPACPLNRLLTLVPPSVSFVYFSSRGIRPVRRRYG